MAQWSFRRRQTECRSCGRPFLDGERHPSVLLFHEGELAREDLCEPCFRELEARQGEESAAVEVHEAAEAPAEPVASPEEAPAPAEPAAEGAEPAAAPPEPDTVEAPFRPTMRDVVFWWFTHHREAPQRATLRLDIEALEALFLKLADFDGQPARELRYLLCLLLMRKRRLKLERVRRGPEGEALVVRRPRRTEEHAVFVFDFTPERIELVRGRLREIFEGVDGDEGLDLAALTEPRPETEDDGEDDGGAEPLAEAAEGPAEPEAEPEAEAAETGESRRG